MDDRLRALERAARTDPSDLAAGWAFVAALDQVGDEVGAWRERCRLARAGDAKAWAQLDRPPLEGVRAVGRTVSRAFDGPDSLRLVAVMDDVLVVEDGPELLGLDPARLVTRWERPQHGSNLWTACGPRTLFAPAGGDELIHFDMRRGAERRRTRLPTSERGWWPAGRVADRVCLVSPTSPDQTGRLIAVDVGDGRGEVVLDVPAAAVTPGDHVAAGVRLQQYAGAVYGYDALTHAHLWSGPEWTLLGLDARGALALVGDARLALADLRTGVVAHEWPIDWQVAARDAHLGHDVVVAVTRTHLLALERESGLERWRVPRPPGAAHLAAARDVLVVATWNDAGAVVGALDVATGQPLWAREVEHAGTTSVEVALAHRTIVAVLVGEASSLLVRINAVEAP